MWSSTNSLSHHEKQNFKNLLPQLIASIITMSNHVTVGISLAYSAVLIPQLLDKNSSIAVTKDQTAWIASVLPLVAPLGSVISGYLMDKYGRITALKLSVPPSICGWCILAMANDVTALIIGRVILGICTILVSSPAIVYVTEIAQKDLRGSLLILGPSFVSLGMTISYLKGWLLDWKTMAWLNNIYLAIPLILIFMVPESPVWLISKGRHVEAKSALVWFYKYQPIPPNQNKTFAELQFQRLIKEDENKNLDVGTTGTSTIKEFLKPTGYKPLLLLCGVFIIQQFSGIYIFLFYSVTFFEAAGTTINPYIASIFIGLIRFVMCLVNSWMLKFIGRRLLLITSAFLMGVCLLISGTFTHKIINGSTKTTWVPAVFLLLYVIASMLGLLAIPWTMTAEMFPLRIRSMAHSAATGIVNFIMFLAVQNYLSLENFLGGSAQVQWFFAGVSFVGVAYFYIFLPETHKKKLSEIEDYFLNNTIYLGQKNPMLDSGDHVMT